MYWGRQGLLGSLEWLEALLIFVQQPESCLHMCSGEKQKTVCFLIEKWLLSLG